MRMVPVILTVLSIVAWGAKAETGAGDRPIHGGALLAVHARPLVMVGEDVIRFSTEPALGGRGLVIELHRRADGAGSGTVFFGWVGGGLWKDLGSISIKLSANESRRLEQQVDAALAEGEPDLVPPGSNEVIVCTDGPVYLTERRAAGRSTWMSGDCDQRHPNNIIARLMMADVVRPACRHAAHSDFCGELGRR